MKAAGDLRHVEDAVARRALRARAPEKVGGTIAERDVVGRATLLHIEHGVVGDPQGRTVERVLRHQGRPAAPEVRGKHLDRLARKGCRYLAVELRTGGEGRGERCRYRDVELGGLKVRCGA